MSKYHEILSRTAITGPVSHQDLDKLEEHMKRMLAITQKGVNDVRVWVNQLLESTNRMDKRIRVLETSPDSSTR